jgi:hypothetical protein
MDEVINLVSQRTGLPADKARVAVETVVEHLKGRLPAPLAAEIDGLLHGGAGGAASALGTLGNIAGGLGGVFGGNK